VRIAVIGTGHVGLVTCATLAALGHDVSGMDSDVEKIDGLQAGRMPFFEPGLKELVDQETGKGRLSFTTDPDVAIAGAEIVFICVGTPPRATGEANLAAVERAAKVAARAATGPVVIVEKSTVPAGTARPLLRSVERERPDLVGQIDIASNPEFLREGRAIEDSLAPDRILVGARSEESFEKLRELYRPLTDKGVPLIETSIETAELAKHACNAFLALKISYANALARICELAGADVEDVTRVMGADPRIGPHFLKAGLGYGGSCFSKDIPAFGRLAASFGYDFRLLGEIERINKGAVDSVMLKITEALWNIEDKRVALLGLSFKPGTDDIRYSPALVMASQLLSEGAHVVGYDPEAGPNAKAELPDIEIASDPYEAARGADCAVICTEWDDIRSLDLARLKEAMAHPILVDGRNLFDRDRMGLEGFAYYPTGRSPVT
jgi:UDPglucose 6-dehydrogenase